MTRHQRCVLLAAVAALAVFPLTAHGLDAPCTAAGDGGDWATYGADLQASHHQVAEHDVRPDTVGSLQQMWTLAGTGYASTPIESGGCLFITTQGTVKALDLATGAVVWQSQANDPFVGGAYAVAVADGRVHVAYPNSGAPMAAALDVSDGHVLWTSETITFGHKANLLSSAVVYNGMQLLFTTGPDYDGLARPGYAILDAATGATLHKQTTIPERDLDRGFAGGGVWSTPSIDPVTNYAFAGTANPDSKTKEHRYDNAIIKIDLDRTRPTFGQIVDAYKGNTDAVVEQLYHTPACQATGDLAPNLGPYGGAPQCGQTDVDFGDGPTLWRNADGELMLAILQKSGMVHALYADTMQKAWEVQLGSNSVLTATGGNFGRTATDGQHLYVAANPGVLWSLATDDGRAEWATPLTFPIQGGNVALAGGVVYHVDTTGGRGWDAATGMPVWQGTLQPCDNTPSAIAVARHTVIVNCAGVISAYQLAPA